ncbi:MAG: YiiD C-terminal domain-containing protein [Spirochaetales bacterium]|nr:YiiD C-terminal domain-containing protein [Spirochaetales bacterium]
MNLLEIPFVKRVGIKKSDTGKMELAYTKEVYNHLETICAGAQYTLAETSSASYLIELFPQLEGKVIPVLRDTKLKFKKPAVTKLTAHNSASDEAVARFKESFDKSGRGLITIDVKLKDEEDSLASSGAYTWYLQKIED